MTVLLSTLLIMRVELKNIISLLRKRGFKMTKKILFEVNKIRKHQWAIFLFAFCSQLGLLYFFSLIGKAAGVDRRTVLTSYTELVGLTAVGSLSFMVVYGSVLVNKTITNHYISRSRFRLYLYPNGRRELYLLKTIAFILVFTIVQFIGMVSAIGVYMASETIAPIITVDSYMWQYGLTFFLIANATALLTVIIVVMSSVIGIVLKSANATIVTGIIAIVLFANSVQNYLAEYPDVMSNIAVVIAALSSIFVWMIGRRIQNDEIMMK